jgi:hypothetical protein
MERVQGATKFVRGPINAVAGDRIDYLLVVTDTGNTSLTVVVADTRCDAGTLSPSGAQLIASGASLDYTCSHALNPLTRGSYRNVAFATGTTPSGAEVGPVESAVDVNVYAPVLRVATLTPAKPAVPVLKSATFTG